MKMRKKASSYSRRRRGIRTRRNELSHRKSLMQNMIGNIMRPSEYFAGVKVIR